MGSDYGVCKARGLGKVQLGGVIFGTTKATINECLSKQLFGLPASHFVYVKKIQPGLPLFLYNYSDKTLAGIFEAASSGQMNIDPYAWNLEGSQRTQYPAQAAAQAEIRNLKGMCNTINVQTCVGSQEFDDIKGKEIIFDSLLDDSILLIGGYDGVSWLSSLDCYSPSQNLSKSLSPMHTERCYAAISKLDGELFVFGGGTRGQWFDTVESYDPAKNRWTFCPLNQKNGSLAGATVKDKIYALGGGNGVDCHSAVEMLDFDVGAWIPTRSMLQKRFALAATELNGALYAVGGFDGKNYLSSAERFDPREHSWKKIESMTTVRGCPCMVVLNEKLFVLGGYDGNAMVSTVEIYDPRRGSWMIGEPMNHPRGYSAAAVAKDCVYIFGGLRSGEIINETVECYREGQGWEVTNGACQRCFFSAVTL